MQQQADSEAVVAVVAAAVPSESLPFILTVVRVAVAVVVAAGAAALRPAKLAAPHTA
jgi:hypothetical protein